MKYTWEPEDIRIGRFFHRGGEAEYAKSCLHKIGRLHLAYHGLDYGTGRKEGETPLYVITAMTDGLVFGPYTAEEMAAHLTKEGYQPTTAKQLMQLLDNRRITADTTLERFGGEVLDEQGK